jgi:3',5'-cyclic AMP phosphodiesterase CpdA
MVVLAHVSDLHLDGGPRAAARTERVLAAIDALRHRIDAVLVTGDLTDSGTAAEYEELRALLGDRQRFLLCPGNHDVRAAYRGVLLGRPATDEPIDQVHDLPRLRVAMCDSTIPGRDDGELGEDTLAWLDGVLADAPATRALVAFHHPPVTLGSPFADALRQHRVERLEALLVAHPQVVGVLCGHAHTAAATTFAGRPLFVAPGVASTLRLPWEDSAVVLDRDLPPALAFHVLDDDGRLTTHVRSVPMEE